MNFSATSSSSRVRGDAADGPRPTPANIKPLLRAASEELLAEADSPAPVGSVVRTSLAKVLGLAAADAGFLATEARLMGTSGSEDLKGFRSALMRTSEFLKRVSGRLSDVSDAVLASEAGAVPTGVRVIKTSEATVASARPETPFFLKNFAGRVDEFIDILERAMEVRSTLVLTGEGRIVLGENFADTREDLLNIQRDLSDALRNGPLQRDLDFTPTSGRVDPMDLRTTRETGHESGIGG